MTPTFTSELAAALEAATLASDYIRSEYEIFTAIPDAPPNISTAIDRGAQEIILLYLRNAFPADALCAEENTQSILNSPVSPRRWVVDPIDGTRGFAMKNGEFSVMIGFTIHDEPVLGVVLEPVTQTYTYAWQGGGCWTRIGNAEPTRCSVRTEADITQGILVQSHSRPGKLSPPVQTLKPASVREMFSAGVKMAVIARGEADVYVNTYSQFSDWDICAGHILVTEAGGQVTGLKGETLRYGRDGFKQDYGMIAATSAIHASIIRGLN